MYDTMVAGKPAPCFNEKGKDYSFVSLSVIQFTPTNTTDYTQNGVDGWLTSRIVTMKHTHTHTKLLPEDGSSGVRWGRWVCLGCVFRVGDGVCCCHQIVLAGRWRWRWWQHNASQQSFIERRSTDEESKGRMEEGGRKNNEGLLLLL